MSKFLFEILKKSKFQLIIDILTLILVLIFNISQPLAWANLLGKLYLKDTNGIYKLLIIVTLLYIGSTIFNFIQTYVSSCLEASIVFNIRNKVYKHILSMSCSSLDNTDSGIILSKLHSDAINIANVIVNNIINTSGDLIRIIILIFITIRINLFITLIVLGIIPITILINNLIAKSVKKVYEHLSKKMDLYFSFVQETINNIREIKSLGIKELMQEKFSQKTKDIQKRSILFGALNSSSRTINNLLNLCIQIIVILFGVNFIVKNQLKVDLFIAYTTYIIQLATSITNISTIIVKLQQAVVSIRRTEDFFDLGLNDNHLFGNIELKKSDDINNIVLDNIIFGYSEQLIIKRVNLKIVKNEPLAIVGASGCGKTTLIDLIQRFYQPNSGEIRIGEIPLNSFSESSLRDNISIVRQDSLLFNMSIRDNFLLIKPDATDKDILEAIDKAFILDEILALPLGLDTLVGDNSVKISVGQRQRLAIARAILKNSPILVFDEATSSLDNKTQFNINKTILNISNNKIVIIIAHRLEAIRNFKKIVVMDEGRITGIGNHLELYGNNQTYKILCDLGQGE